MILLSALVALAADPGVPLEPMSSVPWEAVATEVCGATTNYDGAIVMYRWWIRGDGGRLDAIVNQQVGRPYLNEERFVYGPDGRLVSVERWKTEGGATTLDYVEPVERDADGRVIRGISTATVERSADGRTATETLPGGRVIVWTFDERGVPLQVRGTTNGRPEIETWHRDCSAFPPPPAPAPPPP